MNNFQYVVSPEIFQQFPGYTRGVVVALNVSNGPSPPSLIGLLREAEESVRAQLSIDSLIEHARIKAWRDAYSTFGVKPSKFRSSIEAMARRVLRDQQLPSISRLVDIGNIISLRHLVPAGGHAIDFVKQNLELRPATGNETFLAFGSDELERPLPGEVVFVEGNTVLTRRWTWRQAQHTLLVSETSAVEYNVDGLPPVDEDQVGEICSELSQLVSDFCGGSTHIQILSASNSRIDVSR